MERRRTVYGWKAGQAKASGLSHKRRDPPSRPDITIPIKPAFHALPTASGRQLRLDDAVRTTERTTSAIGP